MRYCVRIFIKLMMKFLGSCMLEVLKIVNPQQFEYNTNSFYFVKSQY